MRGLISTPCFLSFFCCKVQRVLISFVKHSEDRGNTWSEWDIILIEITARRKVLPHSVCSLRLQSCNVFSTHCTLCAVSSSADFSAAWSVPQVKYIQVSLWQVTGQVPQPCEIPFAVDLWICGELLWNNKITADARLYLMTKRQWWIENIERREKAGVKHMGTSPVAGRKGRVTSIPRGVAERAHHWAHVCTPMWRGWAGHVQRCGCRLVPVWKLQGYINEALGLTWYNPEYTYTSPSADLACTQLLAETWVDQPSMVVEIWVPNCLSNNSSLGGNSLADLLSISHSHCVLLDRYLGSLPTSYLWFKGTETRKLLCF